ncbi:MAG: 5-methylcytosine-specific restriction endonuclease system specificity protein McrC [Nitrospirae bacterium]|nr:5-methylcytosine-specific restriction endonuclease system specificity protein McrC [Nitrospirota bacterium]
MIPIQNVYFLLCYAWDRFDEGDMKEVSSTDCRNIADLLATVLCRGVSRLLKKGLDRGYVEQEKIINTVRGRIDIGYTARHGLHQRGRVLCRFDELEYDVLHNQIIKSTLRLLLRLEELGGKNMHDVWGLYRRLTDIGETDLSAATFSRITFHRNNGDYRFLLHICELIATYALPEEKTGSYRFREFLRDEKRMSYIFQQFVLNFLSRELAKKQIRCTVKAERLDWPAEAIDDDRIGDLDYLPAMFTDVSLHFPDKTIIIDTKYYADALKSNQGGAPKANAANLYQINAYLNSLDDSPDGEAEGILLYPTNGTDIDLAWRIHDNIVRVRTLDLGRHWHEIHVNLLGIVETSRGNTHRGQKGL